MALMLDEHELQNRRPHRIDRFRTPNSFLYNKPDGLRLKVYLGKVPGSPTHPPARMPDVIGSRISPPVSLAPLPNSSTPNSIATAINLGSPSSSSTPVTNLPAPPEVESTIRRLSEHKNVRGVIILSRDGVVIRSAGGIFQGSDGVIVLRRYASEVRKIVEVVGHSVDRIELDDQLRFLRIRTQQHELLITPDSKFTLVVIQDPTK